MSGGRRWLITDGTSDGREGGITNEQERRRREMEEKKNEKGYERQGKMASGDSGGLVAAFSAREKGRRRASKESGSDAVNPETGRSLPCTSTRRRSLGLGRAAFAA